MAREWFSFYLYPEENKNYEQEERLISLWDEVSKWLASNTKKSYRLKIIAPLQLTRGNTQLYEAISIDTYRKLATHDVRCWASLQVKFRSQRDAVLFKMFFGDYIKSTRPGIGVLLSLVRRIMPSVIANNIVGVSPMTAPTGMIFAMTAASRHHANVPTPPPTTTKKNIMQKLLENTRKELQKQ
jgi:hypothetical protein